MRISICWICVAAFVLAAAAVGHAFGRATDFAVAAVVVHVAAGILAVIQVRRAAPIELHSKLYGVVSALHDPNVGFGLAILTLSVSPLGRSPD